MGEKRTGGFKRLSFFSAMTALSLGAAFLLTEIFLRIFLPQQEAMGWFTPDQRYGFVMKKNFRQEYQYAGSIFTMIVETNSLGLRDREYDFSESFQKRILLIGDSFTFGYAVQAEDNFDYKLEKLALKKAGENWAVINSGHGGWGTLQASRFARDHFEKFKPDAIVYTFCGNDPNDDVRFSSMRLDPVKGRLKFPGKAFIREHSHLYRLIYKSYKIYENNRRLEKKMAQVDDLQNVVVDTQSASVITPEIWRETLAKIQTLHQSFMEFNPDGRLLIQASAPLNKNIRRNLRSLENGKSLIYVDLADEVQKLPPKDRVLPYDGHWSPAVHTISAQKIFEALQRFSTEPDSSETKTLVNQSWPE